VAGRRAAKQFRLPRYRFYYHDKTIEEVAEIIGVPKNTVKTRMFYARRRIAQLLARHQDFDHLTEAAA
jgi:DNA-directed RNA polymerase specialized sigma24 family protein